VYDLNNDNFPSYISNALQLFDEDSIEKAKKDFFEIKDIDNNTHSSDLIIWAYFLSRKNYQTALRILQN